MKQSLQQTIALNLVAINTKVVKDLMTKILVLGPNATQLLPILGDRLVAESNDPIDVHQLDEIGCDAIISFGYRHKISDHSLERVNGKAINVHISLLPWNRGSNPNFWSWLNNTPKGVSTHWVSSDFDHGDLVSQAVVGFSQDETLRSSYEKLMKTAASSVDDFWTNHGFESAPRQPQPEGGSTHTQGQFNSYSHILRLGNDTLCSEITNFGKQNGLWLLEN